MQNLGIPMSGAACTQCGMFHPPLAPGEECPMKGTLNNKNKTEEIKGLTKFYSDLKNIITSNIQKHNIQNTERIFKHLTIFIASYFENLDKLKNDEEK